MFTKTAMALARAGARRRMSSYGVFLKDNAKNTLLAGKPVSVRGKTLGQMWRALSTKDKKAYQSRAATAFYTPKVKVQKAKKPRKASAFARFVKANYSKVHRLPFNQRLAALAKLYRA
jgi:hypothetical protein